MPQTKITANKNNLKKNPPTEAVKPVEPEKPQYSFRLMFIVVPHGNAEDIREILASSDVNFNLICQGIGTANNQLLSLFGLGDSQRDVLISIVESKKINDVIKNVESLYGSSGIIFTVKLNSIGGMKIIKFLQNETVNEQVKAESKS